jgi:signal recognition particle subunit SRP54
MGDMMGLIEKAESIMNEEEAEDTLKRMKKGKYDLEDFLKQFKQIKKLGPLENIIKMIPGAKKMGLTDVHIDPKEVSRLEAIVLSMTPNERKDPSIIKASRKERIAKGCGQNVQAVNKLLTQFEQSKKMMKMMSNGNMKLPF